MTTVDTIMLDAMNALQTLNRTIPGMQSPPVNAYPTVIDTTGGQPVGLTLAGSGEAWQKGDGYNQSIMTYRIIVFLDPVAQNDVPSHLTEGAILSQQIANLYVNKNNTSIATPPPYQMTIQSGPNGEHLQYIGINPNLSFGGRAWFGFEWHIPVRVEWILP